MYPLVSIIVPTKNSAATLKACLQSVKDQTYPNIEMIVVDNFSTDKTKDITLTFTSRFYSQGPERSPQRNYGVQQSSGVYVAIIDSDMELSPTVIAECVEAIEHTTQPAVVGIIIPEESFGKGFWAQCKKLERSFYVGVPSIEAARFFRRSTYVGLGGYNESLISGEDWDLSDRVEELGKIKSIKSYIYHNEGHISLMKTLKKKYYYASKIKSYMRESKGVTTSKKRKIGVLSRYALFFSHPVKLFRNPLYGIGMLFMKTAEFAAGAFGLILSK